MDDACVFHFSVYQLLIDIRIGRGSGEQLFLWLLWRSGLSFPFVLFFTAAFLISNRKSRIAKIKAAAVIGLFLAVCGIMELLLLGYTQGHELLEYYEAGAKYHSGAA